MTLCLVVVSLWDDRVLKPLDPSSIVRAWTSSAIGVLLGVPLSH